MELSSEKPEPQPYGRDEAVQLWVKTPRGPVYVGALWMEEQVRLWDEANAEVGKGKKK